MKRTLRDILATFRVLADSHAHRDAHIFFSLSFKIQRLFNFTT